MANTFTGKEKFGRLRPLRAVGKYMDGSNIWLCQCDCGETCEVPSYRIKNGKISSCGCLRNEMLAMRSATHRMTKTKFYKVWRGIVDRITLPNCRIYKYYGGRGIKLLWKTFEEFHNDMYDSYLQHKLDNPGHNTTIERMNNDGDYRKENCRWATYYEQAHNKRKNIK